MPLCDTLSLRGPAAGAAFRATPEGETLRPQSSASEDEFQPRCKAERGPTAAWIARALRAHAGWAGTQEVRCPGGSMCSKEVYSCPHSCPEQGAESILMGKQGHHRLPGQAPMETVMFLPQAQPFAL